METFIWICQVLLAASFFYSGLCKAFLPKDKVIAMGQTGVRDIASPVIRLIGVLELLGAAGIILPWSMDDLPVLTPITAACFATLMIFAARIHHRLREPKNVATNIFLFILCLIVAWWRFSQL